MKQKIIFFITAFWALGIITSFAEPVTFSTMLNHYQYYFEGGDHGSIYLEKDNSFMFLPDTTNRDYAHICHGDFKFIEKKQTMTIKTDDLCKFFEGKYQVARQNHNLYLYDGRKTLMFRTLKQMPR